MNVGTAACGAAISIIIIIINVKKKFCSVCDITVC